MKVATRAYNPESKDFDRLCRFIIEDNRARREYFTWQLGRIVDWKYGLWREEKHIPDFFSKNAQLWLDYFDELIGFAISENGDAMFHIFIKDSYAHVYSQMVQWVLEHWSNRKGGLRTQLTEKQTAELRTLGRCGFVSQGVSEVTRMYDTSQAGASEPVIADGFRLVDMATHYDPVGLARLKLDAFHGQGTVSNLDLLAYEYVRTSPIYKPDFDLAIVTREEQYVAACEAFIDYENGVAEIERVCTHSAYRRRGLAQAVIKECFYRLRAHGIPTAFITGMSEDAISLYGKLGHCQEVRRIDMVLAPPSLLS